MMLLAIDPGESTGAVLLEGPLRSVSVVTRLTSEGYNPEPVLGLLLHHQLDAAVVERPPINGNDPRLLALFGVLIDTLTRSGTKTYSMTPSSWKPFARLVTPPQGLRTRHERDAYRMGWVYLRNTRGSA